MKSPQHYFYLFFIALLLFGCNSSNNTSNLNFAYKYDPEPSIIRPSFKVFHLSENKSNLYFSIHSKDVLYTKIFNDTNYESRLKIRYKLFYQDDIKTILDSATYQMNDTTSEGNFDKQLFGGFTLNALNSQKYFVEIRIRDINRDLNIVEFFNFTKSESISDGHFILLDSSNFPILESQVHVNKKFKVVRSPWVDKDNFKLNHYGTNTFGLAPPPFSEDGINYELPKQTKTDQVILFTDTTTLTVKEKGLYHFISDSTDRGFCFLAVSPNYPKLDNIEQFIAPTRFISTQKEYDKLTSYTNSKEGIDEFWLSITNDFKRAKQVLGTYYGRVESSNRFFTDVQEGWQTDRGLIYLIFGAPSTIFKGYNYEKWIYGEESNMLTISFSFKRIETPTSTNTYILERNPTYKSSWYKAVDNWRQGRVY